MTVSRKAYGWGRGLGPTPPRAGAPDRDCVRVGECRPSHRSRKDRGRWCRGKEGVEHQWRWMNDRELPNTTNSLRGHRPCEQDGFGYISEREVCGSCGKQRASRHRCHCGALMPDKAWSATACPMCAYTPHWPLKKYRDVNDKIIWLPKPGRPAHLCKQEPR